MKRTLMILLGVLFSVSAFAQTNAIDEMMDKYSDREGYTYVSISGKMLGMLASMQSEEEKAQSPLPKIKSIRILTTDSLNVYKVNFYNELSKKVDFSAYEELMVVKEQKEITKFLVKHNGNMISDIFAFLPNTFNLGGPLHSCFSKSSLCGLYPNEGACLFQ